jgi:hypothetical protein
MFQTDSRKSEDYRDIEQIIYDIVEYQNDEDFERLYELLVDKQLFLPVAPESMRLIPDGVNPGDESFDEYLPQLMFCGKTMSGETYISVLTVSSSPQLVDKNCLEIHWLDFLDMVLKLEYVSGFTLQGTLSWMSLGKDEVRYILNKYRHSNGYKYMNFQAGGVYSCKSGDDGFSIVKVLVVEEIGVHVCLYSNTFNERPREINPRELQVSIGHAPILRTGFTQWEPELMFTEMITEEDLSGYYCYLNAMSRST